MDWKKVFNPNSLYFRLFFTLWFFCAGMLLLAGIYIDQSIDTSFRHFVQSTAEAERETVLAVLSDILKEDTNGRGQFSAVNHLARTHNERIIIWDEDGNRVHDTLEHGWQRGMRMREEAEQEAAHLSPSFLEENTYALPEDIPYDRATMISTDRGADNLTTLEYDFTWEITKSVLMGGGLSLVLSVLISIMISISISKPIFGLKRTAEKLKAGHLQERVSEVGPEEIKSLSESFNAMADTIEKADYLKKKLTQDISHELRNPVSSIKGYLEAFQDGVLMPDSANLSQTLAELKRLEEMTRDLHQLARMDFQESKKEKQPVNLTEVVEQIASGMEPILQRTGVAFLYQPPRAQYHILGDKEKLYAAIDNLVKNAIKYTPEGGQIELGVQLKGDKHVVVFVSDTGRGISKDKLPYIFERFYRAESSRTRDSRDKGGSGLGLALVKEWVEWMEGRVTVHSELGQGSTFEVILPLFL